MIYLTTTQNQYENVYGTEIWNTSLNGVTLEDNVKETVLARIAQIKTMYLLAKEKEVTLDEAEEAKVVQAAQEYYSSLNDTEIEAMGATEEIVENLYREYAMADKVYQLIIQDINPEISDDEARKITVQQIFFATASTDMDGNLKPYSESSIQSAYGESLRGKRPGGGRRTRFHGTGIQIQRRFRDHLFLWQRRSGERL